MQRGVPQLTQINLFYSRFSPASIGVREYLNSNLHLEYRLNNPTVKFKLISSHKTFPRMQAEYVGDGLHARSLRDCMTTSSVGDMVQVLTDKSGRRTGKMGRRPFAETQTPSLQGRWNSQFNLKTNDEQLAPLIHKEEQLQGLAPKAL